MVKKTISKIGDKLAKVSDSFTVNIYDNGYMLEISGRDRDNEWKNAKVLVQNLAQLNDLITEVSELPRDE
jgi:hypothetical protein